VIQEQVKQVIGCSMMATIFQTYPAYKLADFFWQNKAWWRKRGKEGGFIAENEILATENAEYWGNSSKIFVRMINELIMFFFQIGGYNEHSRPDVNSVLNCYTDAVKNLY
jgi:hypothetical protein